MQPLWLQDETSLENHCSPFLRRYLALPSQSLASTDSSLYFQKRRYVTIRLTTELSVSVIGCNDWQRFRTRDNAIVTVTVDAVTNRPGVSIHICICILVLTQVIWETNRQQIGTEKICFDRKWVTLEKESPPLSPHVVFNLTVLPLRLFFGTLPLEIQADLKIVNSMLLILLTCTSHDPTRLLCEDQIPKSKNSLRVITFEIGPTKGYSLINLPSLNCRWRLCIGFITKLPNLFCLIIRTFAPRELTNFMLHVHSR